MVCVLSKLFKGKTSEFQLMWRAEEIVCDLDSGNAWGKAGVSFLLQITDGFQLKTH